MAFYSLPLEKNEVTVPREYCYLVIRKYNEDSFKPSNGKKLSAKDNSDKKESLARQNKTIQELDKGFCNLLNNKIQLSSIFNSTFVSELEKDDSIIYKIEPNLAYKGAEGYYNKTTYHTSEFKVIKKFENPYEVVNEIHKDGLLREFSAIVFDSYSYGNEGYDLKLAGYFQNIKGCFDKFEVSLQDIVLTNDYNHQPREKFNKGNTYDTTRKNIRYLLDNDLIKYFKVGDYYQDELIIGLIECGLYDISLSCMKLLDDYTLDGLIKNKKLDIVLRKYSTEEIVKEIIKFLNIKLSGVNLTIKDHYDDIKETKTFNNIGDVKTYLIKKYNVSFDKIITEDICDIKAYDEDTDVEYKFEIS